MDKVNSDWISSPKIVDSSIQSENKVWKTQRGVVSKQSTTRSWRRKMWSGENIEIDGKHNENKENDSETDYEEQGSKVYSCSYWNLSIVRFYEELHCGRNVKGRIHVMKFISAVIHLRIRSWLWCIRQRGSRIHERRVLSLPRKLDRIMHPELIWVLLFQVMKVMVW